MTKKSSSKKSSSGGLTLSSLIVGAIVLIIGFFASLIGGGNTPTTTPVATTVQQSTARPTTASATRAPSGGSTVVPTVASGVGVTQISIPLGYGAQKGFWRVFFTAPTGSRDPSTYVGGIDTQLAADIAKVQRTLDIAAFEFNNVVLTQAVLDAKSRGVVVRMVTDDDSGLNDRDTTIGQFVAAGIPVVDDSRSALMHNKFMILDSSTVWTGSWNYTINDTYRNNNNALALRSRNAVSDYQTEFNEMFEQKQFGPRSPANTPFSSFTQDGDAIQVYFSPEDDVLSALVTNLGTATKSVRFMTFSFTDFDAANALLQRSAAGVTVTGIWETTGSETDASELHTLFCAGIDARQDGNPFVLHHKVFIIDDKTVISGSFNISSNATNSNDENLIIITDPDLAAQYITEFNRRWAESKIPTRLTCS